MTELFSHLLSPRVIDSFYRDWYFWGILILIGVYRYRVNPSPFTITLLVASCLMLLKSILLYVKIPLEILIQ